MAGGSDNVPRLCKLYHSSHVSTIGAFDRTLRRHWPGVDVFVRIRAVWRHAICGKDVYKKEPGPGPYGPVHPGFYGKRNDSVVVVGDFSPSAPEIRALIRLLRDRQLPLVDAKRGASLVTQFVSVKGPHPTSCLECRKNGAYISFA